MSSKHYQFLFFSLFFFELMTCKIFFTVRVQIENLARSNLLTKEYFISAKERSDRRKRIFIKTISCHENYFISFSLLVQFSSKWFCICLLLLPLFIFRACNVGEVFHQVFSDELVQEGLLNSLMPFLIPSRKQLQSSAGSVLSSNSLANSLSSNGK